MAAPQIHPSALIERGVELAEDVVVGPFCTIAAGARIGKGTKLMSHVVIDGLTEIGEQNTFFPFCVIGLPPQDLSYAGDPTKTIIGNRNTFRESVSIHRGTARGRGMTQIGDDNFIMGFCHFAHDNKIGNFLIMANQASLAGHVTVGDHVVIGGQAGIAQHCRIGDFAFVTGGSGVRKDLPPYLCSKEFAEVSGPNLVGLRRKKVGEENIRVACELYKILYLGNLTTEKACVEIEQRFPTNDFAQKFVLFIRETKVGIQR